MRLVTISLQDKKDKKDKKEKKGKDDSDEEEGYKKKKTVSLEEQSPIRYQVAVAPEYLRRPAGVEGDERVPFKPDGMNSEKYSIW